MLSEQTQRGSPEQVVGQTAPLLASAQYGTDTTADAGHGVQRRAAPHCVVLSSRHSNLHGASLLVQYCSLEHATQISLFWHVKLPAAA